MRSRWARWALLSSACVGACSFDVTRLYPPPSDGDAAVVMDASEDVVDVVTDSGPQRTCQQLADGMNIRTIGGSLVVEGTTARAESTVNPIAMCTMMSDGAPEIFFEYQVQRGGTLVASTDVPNVGMGCPRFADSIVSIQRGSCDMPGDVLACNDDSGESFACQSAASRTIATGLMQFDRVMIVVDGYQANSGPFTLTVTENALREAPVSGAMTADPCGCPGVTTTSAGTTTEDVAISLAADVGGGSQRELAMPGDSIGGARTVMGTRVAGIAATIGLTANEFRSRAVCNTHSAIFDLVIGTQVVRSFVVDRNTETLPTPRLMFRSAPNIPMMANTNVQIRMRSTTAPDMMDRCSVTFGSATGAGTITLLTTR
jgi:hypothetical protein